MPPPTTGHQPDKFGEIVDIPINGAVNKGIHHHINYCSSGVV
jgi:ribosomal protein L21E